MDELRARAGAHGNAAIDECLAGRIGRRELLRYLAAIGVGGLALPRAALARSAQAGQSTQRGQAGATIRVAALTPTGAVDPVRLSDPAGIGIVCQSAEYLIDDDGDTLTLRPSLAVSWQSDADGRTWTFRLRDGVRFHDGRALDAADVVATFDRLTDPAVGSAGLSVLKGVLSKGGARRADRLTVVFHLDAPNGNFPYYVSSDNFNAAIVPADYRGDFEKRSTGTGPFRLERFTPMVGASFVRNHDYWGGAVLPERVEFRFYADQQSQLLALRGGDADLMVDFTPLNARSMLQDRQFRVSRVRSSAHRQLHMRCDRGPFADARVRRALALSIDRGAIVDGFFLGRASAGADHPFAPVFPSTPPASPQRGQRIDEARRLLAEAGFPNGFSSTLTTETYMELPDYAVLLQSAARSIGIDLRLRVESQAAYYGTAAFGQSDWLDAPVGLTDYGHRGVPNIFLEAPLTSNGAWNAAHFRDGGYDKLVKSYAAALQLADQRRIASQIVDRLQRETPVIIGYFYDGLALSRRSLQGFAFTAISQIWLAHASFS
ncbi:ABC transporter substrate-binding protein [Chitinasiproducens palmae]|uniref:ABC transporter substrate-binding protein n=1 Tax=Chitinasiproducens palmae TaxID=1770053 RepID=UPI0014802B3A|nr:ABC transporter substrate-binding protein [Chitinasiproducens palmae]